MFVRRSGRRQLEARARELHEAFGIKKLLLEGGGKINGSFLAADLVDELSLLLAPVVDSSVGTPMLFDAGAVPVARRLKLASVQKRLGELVWLRYTTATSR